MTIAAKITPAELVDQVSDRFVDQFFLVKLLNASGLTYVPGITNENTFVADNELVPGTFGYVPQTFGYTGADVGNYADSGVGLLQKQCIFAHDGSNSQYSFTHCSVQWADGVPLTIAPDGTLLPTGVIPDGTYENLPVTSDGAGYGMTVDITINNTFTGTDVYSISLNNRGYGYNQIDLLTISSSTLAAVGAGDGSQGPIGIVITGLYNPINAGQVFAIAPTNGTITLANGNESAFYFNLRQFGFYNVGPTE